MAQTKDYNLSIEETLVKSYILAEYKFRSDLHTHMNAILSPDLLISLGINHQIKYPLYYIRKIGLKLKSVSAHSQVICVTHSAQIASVADNHLLINKEFDDDRTFTSVKPLDKNGRINELARIMGGLDITDSLLKSAEELLQIDN